MIVAQNIFLSLMILISVYFSYLDIKTQKIPRLFSYLFLGFCFLGGFFVTGQPTNAIFTGLFGFGLFYLVRKLTKNKLGLADCFFSSGIGFFFGFEIWLKISYIGCIVAFFMFCRFYIIKHFFKGHVQQDEYSKKMKLFIPFIPCLNFGVIIFTLTKLFQ